MIVLLFFYNCMAVFPLYILLPNISIKQLHPWLIAASPLLCFNIQKKKIKWFLFEVRVNHNCGKNIIIFLRHTLVSRHFCMSGLVKSLFEKYQQSQLADGLYGWNCCQNCHCCFSRFQANTGKKIQLNRTKVERKI